MASPPPLNRSLSAADRRRLASGDSGGPSSRAPSPAMLALPPTTSSAAREPRTVLESFVLDVKGSLSSSLAYASSSSRGGQGSPLGGPMTPTLYNRSPLTPGFARSGGGGLTPSTIAADASYFPSVIYEDRTSDTYDKGVVEKEEVTAGSEQPLLSSTTTKGLGRPGTDLDRPRSFWDGEVFWLGTYFVFNLGLTLFNKLVLVSFPYPYTLTGIHTLSGCVGSYIALERGHFTPAHLSAADNVKLALFSVLYTVNIAVSNVSLQLVTVPFHQVVRASAPLFIISISVLVLKQRISSRKLISLLPVMFGVGLATYGDYYFTLAGLLLTLFGTFLAALKTITTNVLQTGSGGRLKLHPLDLLMRMSPLAFVQCILYSWSSGELGRVARFGAHEMDRMQALSLVVNGAIAFGLNVVSFTANKKTSALTMTVAANVKQVMTIILAVLVFNLTITPLNGLGILLTLFGGASYAYIGYNEKRQSS